MKGRFNIEMQHPELYKFNSLDATKVESENMDIYIKSAHAESAPTSD
jgi:hypothetical protein